MDTPFNRMEKSVRRTPGSEATAATPIAIPGRVTPFVAKCCGKGQSPLVLRTEPEKGYALVACGACGKKLRFFYISAEHPAPRHEVM